MPDPRIRAGARRVGTRTRRGEATQGHTTRLRRVPERGPARPTHALRAWVPAHPQGRAAMRQVAASFVVDSRTRLASSSHPRFAWVPVHCSLGEPGAGAPAGAPTREARGSGSGEFSDGAYNSERRMATFWSSPIWMPFATSAVPPYETSGRGRPVTGAQPIVMSTLTMM
jgi:hypothetical protein